MKFVYSRLVFASRKLRNGFVVIFIGSNGTVRYAVKLLLSLEDIKTTLP